MATTIQVSKDLRNALERMKFVSSESYEEVIWDLMDDHLDEKTKKDMEKGREDYKKGKYSTMEEVKKKLGL